LYDVLKADELNDAEKLYLIEDFEEVLSLGLLEEDAQIEHDEDEVKYIDEMIAKRTEAKKNKDFKLADEIRDELLNKGIQIKDTREGVIWSKI